MNYQFPLIRNIQDVLPAIEGRPEFVVAEKEGYTVINYNVMMADTFPPVLVMADAPDFTGGLMGFVAGEIEDTNAAIRRECRGIIFDTATGDIIRRPYHKFFNVNERDETQDNVVDLSQDHAILEKLDGSMIAPFMVGDCMIWGTKMGATDVAKPVEEFVKNNPKYENLAFTLLLYGHGLTPIFEWCSRKQRIVLDYDKDQLILTAVRNMRTGEYISYEKLCEYARIYDIPVVRVFDPQTDMKAFVEYVRDLEKLDGSMIAPFIVNGEMIWGTKMGATDVAKPVEQFVKNNPQYVKFAEQEIQLGWTPIFEWCSRKQRIVLDYKEDQLVLTAIRNIKTGEYAKHTVLLEFGAMYDIPVVRAFDPQTDMKSFVEYVRDLEDLEGFVVRFADGHMLKLKCHWYLQIHKAKEAILQDRNIVELILDEKLDDVKAHLPAEDRDRLTQFESYFNSDITHRRRTIEEYLYKLEIMNIDRKTFALEYADRNHIDSYSRSIIFKNFDGCTREKIEADIRNTIRNNLTKTAKYEAIRDAWFPGVMYNV